MNMESNIQNVSIEAIIPNRFQPRLSFDEQALNDLAASIKEHGIIQPIVLRRIGNKYEIIAGERRYKAAQIAGYTEVPAIIANVDDNTSAEVALAENVQRKNLSSIEEAKSYKKILDRGYMNQADLAQKLGVSQPTIANKIRLLSLTKEVQEALMNEKISERHARSLLQIEDQSKQIEMLNRVVTERLTVRQLDDEIKKLTSGVVNTEPTISTDEPVPASTNNVEESGTTVPNEPQPISQNVLDLFKSLTPDVPASNLNVLNVEQKEEPTEETLESLDTLVPETPNDFDVNPEEIKATSEDIIPKATTPSIFNIFDEKGYSSLEDEATSLATSEEPDDESFNPFNRSKNMFDENLDEVEVEPSPVKEEIVNPKAPEPVIEERIKPNDLSSVKKAYEELNAEAKEKGYKITSEDFDFEDLYQIIIKIDKRAD